jgi:hypothetical protein
VIIFPPNALPPAPGMSPAPDATLVVTQKRPVPGYFAAVAQHCNDLLARLHEAVENELQGLFGSIGSIPPFDLLTGEERRPQMNAEIVSEGQIPRLPK